MTPLSPQETVERTLNQGAVEMQQGMRAQAAVRNFARQVLAQGEWEIASRQLKGDDKQLIAGMRALLTSQQAIFQEVEE